MGVYSDRARVLRDNIVLASKSLPDEKAIESPELFERWKTNTPYSVEDRIAYNDSVYDCIQAHTSQDDWTPPVVPALWKLVSLDEWPEWVQPTGAHDAYNKGDKVTHNGIHYVSDVDGNVWEPPTMWTRKET